MRAIKIIALAIDHAIDWISTHAALLAGILILIMGFLSTFGVFMRYVIHDPEAYSYELSTIFLLACVMLAIAYLQRQGRQLRVDFISNRFSKTAQDILLNIVVPLVALTYIVTITWHSWEYAMYAFSIGEKSTSSWREPIGPIRMIVPITSGLLCLVLFSQLFRGIVSLIRAVTKKTGKIVNTT